MRLHTTIIAATILLGACATGPPPPQQATLTISSVDGSRTNFPCDGDELHSIFCYTTLLVRASVSNTTSRTLSVEITDFSLRIAQAHLDHGRLLILDSTCNASTVNPGSGTSCTLHFEFSKGWYDGTIFPATLRFSDAASNVTASATIDNPDAP